MADSRPRPLLLMSYFSQILLYNLYLILKQERFLPSFFVHLDMWDPPVSGFPSRSLPLCTSLPMPTRPPSIGSFSLPRFQRENKTVETKFREKSIKKKRRKKIPSRDPAVLTGAFAVESRCGAQPELPLTRELGPHHRSLWRSAVGPPAHAAVRRELVPCRHSCGWPLGQPSCRLHRPVDGSSRSPAPGARLHHCSAPLSREVPAPAAVHACEERERK
jgi:hypothetical protein